MNQKPNTVRAARKSSTTQGTPAPQPGKATIKQLATAVNNLQQRAQNMHFVVTNSCNYLTQVHYQQQKQVMALQNTYNSLFTGKKPKPLTPQRLARLKAALQASLTGLTATQVNLGNELDFLKRC